MVPMLFQKMGGTPEVGLMHSGFYPEQEKSMGKNADYFCVRQWGLIQKECQSYQSLIVGKTVGKKEKGPEGPYFY